MKQNLTTYIVVALVIAALSSVLTYYVHRHLDRIHDPTHNA